MLRHPLTRQLLIGEAPTAEDLHGLVAAGVRTIVDLRTDEEPRPRGLAPWEEAARARQVGLSYLHIPVAPPSLSDELAGVIRRALAGATPRVFMHCTSGRRAGTFGLLVLACDQAVDTTECLRRGHALGLDFEGMPRLTAFLRRYVERHGNRAAAIRPAPDYTI
jgi:uncharacterized protein (TIGR01244 family)